MTPFRFTPSTQSHSPGGHSHSGPCGPPTPALLQTTWTAPNATAPSPERLDRREDATSVATGSTDAPDVGEGRGRLGQRGLLDVGHHHVQALGREPLGQPEPDPAGGAGDDGHPAGGDRIGGAERPAR